MAPKIEIDAAKCQTPFLCKMCLLSCPTSVFNLQAAKVEKFKETDPREQGSYVVLPVFKDRCIGCLDCVRACPQGAIAVTYNTWLEAY